MNTQTRLDAKTADLLAVPFLLVMALSAYACGAISQPAEVQATPVAVVAPAAGAGVIDHAVLLNDPDVLVAPNPAPMAVAAYDD
jgi:hypothetical protein